MRFLYNNKRQEAFRRELRARSTPAETILWQFIRAKRFMYFKFRRQYGVGKYILDFFCLKLRLAIEVDGDSHFNDKAIITDRIRETFLKKLDIRVVRFTNQEIYFDFENVMNRLRQSIIDRLPKIDTSPNPSYARRGTVKPNSFIKGESKPTPPRIELVPSHAREGARPARFALRPARLRIDEVDAGGSKAGGGGTVTH